MPSSSYPFRPAEEPRPRFLTVDQAGRLVLPPELGERFGLRPGARVYLEEGAEALLLHRPVGQLRRIYVELTTRCNFDCPMCLRRVWEEPPGSMDQALFERVLAGAAQVEPRPTIFLGGYGEPLLHPEAVAWAARAKAVGCPVELITNGVLLDKPLAQAFFDLGLDRLWVSLDGAEPGGSGAAHPEAARPTVLANLRHLNRLKLYFRHEKPRIGLSFVASRRNLEQLPAVVDLGAQVGAERFLVSNLLPHTPELKDEVLFRRALWNQRRHFLQIGLPRLDATPEALEAMKKLLAVYEVTDFKGRQFAKPFDTCPFVERGSLAVRWDGRVSPCLPLLHPQTSYLDETVRRTEAHLVGDLNRQELLEIWTDPEYLALRERLREFDFSPCTSCNSCELAESNEEDCYGNRRPACGGCLWAQGFIQCP